MPIKLNISKEDCSNIAEVLEIYFFQNIRDDVGIDNIECVHSKERKIKDTVICSKYNAYKDVNGFCEAGEKKV